MDAYLERLNPEQLLPVKDTEGAVLVIAGAGSGKTRVLTSRIIYLVENLKVDPSSILAITFTSKAAGEMKERLEKSLDNVSQMWISTIHSMCVRILRQEAEHIGYNRNFSIYSETEKDSVLKKIIKENNISDEGFLKNLKNGISHAKSKGQSPQEYLLDNKRYIQAEKVYRCYKQYEEHLKANNALDFDDLLIKTEQLFLENPQVCLKYAQKFNYVHVDEYQDTNKTQYNIIRQLSSYHKNIFVVGDDDQSIYGWRGADISNILDFEKDFKNAKVYKLERNYRSTKKILNLANKVIKKNNERKDKTLWTENEEGAGIVAYSGADEISEAEYCALQIKSLVSRGASYSDFAVLMRLNALSRSFEAEFLKYGINYKVFGGFKFYERKEIKDLTAYIRVLVNPLDSEALVRIINTPKRGIGEKMVQTLQDYAERENVSLFDAIFEAEETGLTKLGLNKIADFRSLLSDLIVDRETKTITECIKSIVDKTNFYEQFEDTEEGINKRHNIDEFISSAEEYEKLNLTSNLTDFLSSVTLSSDTDEMDNSEYVTIATIHSVKGLEFKTVFIVGAEEGIFPITRAIDSEFELEEERRLMYVAITRARERLFVTRSNQRFLYGERKRMLPSRFLLEADLVTPPKQQAEVKREGGFGLFNTDTERTPSASIGKTASFNSSYRQVPPKQSSGNKNIADYKRGVKVKHIKFGVGTIIDIKGNGDNTIVDVAFLGVGIKSLSVKFAPMEILG